MIIDNLENNEAGEIFLPIQSKKKGKNISGYIDKDILLNNFGEFLEKDYPLSDEDYNNLLDKSSQIWKENWIKLREQERI